MVLGMSLETYTLLHVLISLAGIASGLVVMYGFLTNQRLIGWNTVFLTTTVLTSVTGFLFPYNGMTPAIKVGIISLVVLAIALVARYRLQPAWRKTYAISASAALYFTVFDRLSEDGPQNLSKGVSHNAGRLHAAEQYQVTRAEHSGNHSWVVYWSRFLWLRYTEDGARANVPILVRVSEV